MTDKEPQSIRQSGDPDQGAPNKHQSQAEWERLKTARKVKDESGGDSLGAAEGAESFGTTPGSVTTPRTNP